MQYAENPTPTPRIIKDLAPPNPIQLAIHCSSWVKHVIGRIRRNWPRVEITVRGDGHFGAPEVMEFLEDQGCGYIFGLPGNARLSKIGHVMFLRGHVAGTQHGT